MMQKYSLSLILLLALAAILTGQQLQADGYTGTKLVTIHAEDAHLPTVLSILAEESGYNIVTSPEVNSQDRISVHMDDVPIEQAVNLVVRAAGLSYELVGRSFLVATASRLSEEIGVKSYVIPLQYATSNTVKELLKHITENISVDTTGNKILVTTSPKNIVEIIEVIDAVDVPVLQIMLEARLIEVTMGDEDQLGIDWARLASITTILAENAAPTLQEIGGSLVPGMTQQTQFDGSVIEQYAALPTGRVPDQMYFQRIDPNNEVGFSRQLSAFDLTLDMLIKDNSAEILTNTQLVTLNGRKASVELIDVVPFILSSGGIGGQVQVQREIVGIRLEVQPNVNTDGYITTTVRPEVSSIFDFVGPERNIPWVKKRITETTVRVQDGQSIIISGLLGLDRINVTHTVPLLHRLPFIGKFFVHNFLQETRTDMIVEITPHIIVDEYSGIIKNEHMQNLEDIYINVRDADEAESESNEPTEAGE